MKKAILLMVIILIAGACKKGDEDNTAAQNYICTIAPKKNDLTQNQLTAALDNSLVQRAAATFTPTTNGAMSRNRTAYFHVRFQNGISQLADYAIDAQRADALENTIKAIEYSYQYQFSNGNFDLVTPLGLNLPPPSIGDSASGVAFFMASLGPALLALQESSWYNALSNAAYVTRVEALRPKIKKSLDWLISKQIILEQYDANAPNRLLFDALAIYTIGKWLNDEAAKEIGRSFARTALAKRHPDGYFLEANGWDSSYQGVSLSNGFKLYSLLDVTDAIKNQLWDAISCGTNWLSSRVLGNGEISTEKNTRVYPGGEQFLGQEKTMAWTNTVMALLAMHHYTGNPVYLTQGQKVEAFYR
jgi:hypothetical protein